MNEAPSPPTIDELVQFIGTHVAEHHAKTGRRTDGAALAFAIRAKFPGLDYHDLGVSRLADVVLLAERKGQVIRHRDVRHLEVSPSSAREMSTQLEDHTTYAQARPRVRSDIWRAFVFVSPDEQHILERATGRLISGSAIGETMPTDFDDHRYVRITRISPDLQKEWMRQFVQSRDSLNIDEAPIDVENWWRQFPDWVRKISPDLEQEWRRFRTKQVSTFLRRWAESNEVPSASLFVTTQPRHAPETSIAATPEDEQAIRRAVIAAISEMPLTELEDLQIPVRYMLRHFRAQP